MRRNLVFLICIVVYIFAGVILLPYYRYQINPDGVSYISIAQKYLNGEFAGAVNGYWGPMISWLMVPLLALGIDGLLTAKIVTLIVGLISLIGIWFLSFRFEMSEKVRMWILFTTVPAMLAFAMMTITPDILVLCVLIYYLYFIFGKKYSISMSNGVLCGLLGGIGYLCKSFIFPFFIVHFFVFNLLHFLRSTAKNNRKVIVKNYLIGMLVFIAISIPWITAISVKYEKLTFSTSGAFVHSLRMINRINYPFDKVGFIEPSNATAISAWEDLLYMETQYKKQYRIGDFLLKQMQIVMNNFKSTSILNPTLFPFFLPTIIICILFFMPFNKTALNSSIFYSIVTIGIYCGLYSFILILDRYIEIVYILAILLGGKMLNTLIKTECFSRHRKNLALILFFLLFIAAPIEYLSKHTYFMKGVYDISRKLENTLPADARVASNKEWTKSLYLSYYLNSRYYGRARNGVDVDELKSDLDKFEIEYYMEWGKKADFDFLEEYEEVTNGRIPNLRVYRIAPANE